MPQVIERFRFKTQRDRWFPECERNACRDYETTSATRDEPFRHIRPAEAERESPTFRLSRVEAVIEDSRRLLDLQDNWDGEGAHVICHETWQRAVEFLARNARWLWDRNQFVIEPPDITPVPDGSVDLHWDKPSHELLINIPPDKNAMAGFYGDDRGRISIRGELDTDQINEGLILWLTKI